MPGILLRDSLTESKQINAVTCIYLPPAGENQPFGIGICYCPGLYSSSFLLTNRGKLR